MKKLLILGGMVLAVAASTLAYFFLVSRDKREFTIGQEKFQAAVKERAKTKSDIDFSDLQIKVVGRSMIVTTSFRTLLLDTPTLVTVDIRGDPQHKAFRETFRFKALKWELREVRVLPKDASRKGLLGFSEMRIMNEVESAISDAFAQVRGRDVDEHVRWYYWLNDARIRDGKIVLQYSFVQSTQTAGIIAIVLLILMIGAYLLFFQER